MDELTGIENWFKERNLDKADPSHQMIKATEELGELAEAHNKGWDDKAKDSLGDLVVVLDGYAIQRGWHLADCIKDAHDDIRNRKGKIINGVFVKQYDLDKE